MKGLYQKREWWYYQPPTPAGGGVRPKPVALKTQDEVTAINAVTDMQWNGMILEAETKGTLAEILPRYYEAKREDRKSTKRARKTILDAFKDRMGNPKLADINKEMLLEWRRLLATTGGTNQTEERVNATSMTSYLITLKAFLNWAVKEKLIRKNPATDMGKQSTVRKTRREKFHTLEARERLLAENGPDYVMFINFVGFFAGLRIGEMLAMKKEWIYIAPDHSHGSIHVHPTMIEVEKEGLVLWEPKTLRGTRTIPLHQRLIDFLLEYGMREPYMLAPHKPVFPPDDKQSLRFDPKKALANHAKACGISKTNYHMLRHSFGTHLAMGGMTMADLAGLLGETVIVCESTYAGYSPRKTKNLLPGL